VSATFAAPPAHAAPYDPRVLIMAVEGDVPAELGPLRTDVRRALADGAEAATAIVSEGRVTFDESAVIAGCVPEDPGCADAVVQALDVDQLLIARLAWTGDHGEVEIHAITLEAEPVIRTFAVWPATRDADVDAIRVAVPKMLGWEARVAPPPPPPPAAIAMRSLEREPVSRIPPSLVIGGGVAIVAGAISWAVAASLQGDIDDAPIGTPAEIEHLAALEDRAALTATVGNVLVFAGALVGAVGGAWWWHDHRSRGTLAISAAPGGATVTLGGAW